MVKTDTSLSSSEGTAPRPGLEMDDMDKLASAVVHFKITQFLNNLLKFSSDQFCNLNGQNEY